MASDIRRLRPHRSFGLDLIRATAIVLVLVSHFSKKLDGLGFWGVELFFVLSGYLIGQILWRNYSVSDQWRIRNLINFWSRRWWRTLPNYYLFLVVMIIFHYFLKPPVPKFSTITDFFWFGQNLLSRNQGFYSVSWSLCIEEWFYLLFPFFLLVFSKLGCGIKTSFIATLIIFLLSSVVIRYYLVKADADHIRMITLARLDSICFGVLVAFISSVVTVTLKIRRVVFAIGAAILLTLFVAIVCLGISFSQLSKNQYLLFLIPLSLSLLLPLASVLASPVGRYQGLAVSVERLSLWSYSIYLSHIPIMFTIYALMDQLRDNMVWNMISKIIALGVTILISRYIFNFFEVPLTRRRPKEVIS